MAQDPAACSLDVTIDASSISTQNTVRTVSAAGAGAEPVSIDRGMVDLSAVTIRRLRPSSGQNGR